jgi:hypothetical protein
VGLVLAVLTVFIIVISYGSRKNVASTTQDIGTASVAKADEALTALKAGSAQAFAVIGPNYTQLESGTSEDEFKEQIYQPLSATIKFDSCKNPVATDSDSSDTKEIRYDCASQTSNTQKLKLVVAVTSKNSTLQYSGLWFEGSKWSKPE